MSDDDDKKLRMSFDPMTIEHLGLNMYSTLPNALAELIANAYDADASCVHINLHDDGSDKYIEVIDDGVGMDFDEVNKKFLCIGRNRRVAEEDNYSPSGKRKVTGKKGLGKLALFGLAQKIRIETMREGMDEKIIFEMDWNEITKPKKPEDEPEPYLLDFELKPCKPSERGTTTTLLNLKRKSRFDKKGLAVSLSKLFVFFDEGFKCYLTQNGTNSMTVSHDLKYKNKSFKKQFSWTFEELAAGIDKKFKHENRISGEIISAIKPLQPDLRGITLYANGRLVNAPEFFRDSESSHAYSYLTGWLEVDYIDEFNEDMISTNRQSLKWENEEMKKLRDFLSEIIQKAAGEWRKSRKEEKQKKIIKETGVDIKDWVSKTPEPVGKIIQKVSEQVTDSEEVDSALARGIMQSIHELVPEYPDYHWRHLHPEVQRASKRYYQDREYYTALFKSIQRYIAKIKEHVSTQSGELSERNMLGRVFKPDQPELNVTNKYAHHSAFNNSLLRNIRDGQMLLSQGVWSGARNSVAHPEEDALRDTHLFTEKDCLDALSILSHLFRRLDDAIEFLDSPDKTP